MPRETRYNTTSSFPNNVDELLFLQDIDIEHISESENHQELLANGEYTNAGEYLEKTATIDSWCASLFNLIENRLLTTQQYLLTKTTGWYDEQGVPSPFAFGEEPDEEDRTTIPIWIE